VNSKSECIPRPDFFRTAGSFNNGGRSLRAKSEPDVITGQKASGRPVNPEIIHGGTGKNKVPFFLKWGVYPIDMVTIERVHVEQK
jgi:hypothetical protein